MKITSLHIINWIKYLLVVAVLCYVAVRAFSLSFTHDEAVSYTLATGDNSYANTANHHLLNTWLMTTSRSVFGISEWALRLPNVLAFLLYAAGYFLLTNRTKFKHSWLLFGLYFFNPFILDFFSLARGYGLSLGFLSLSVYGLVRYTEATSFQSFLRFFAYSLLMGSLSLLANLSVVNYFLVALGYGIMLYLVRFRKSTHQGLRIGFFTSLAGGFFLLIFVVKRLLFLKETNQLYFGADSIQDSIASFVANTFYGFGYSEVAYYGLPYLFIAAFLIRLIGLCFKFKRIFSQGVLLVFPIVFVGLLLEHILFEAKYPLGRTTLVFYVLFLFFVFHSFSFKSNSILKKITSVISVVGFLMLGYHFVNVANTTKTANWTYDAATKQVMQQVAELNELKPITFSANWLFQPSMNYYIDLYEIEIEKLDREGVRDSTDYFYEFEKNIETAPDLNIIEKYPVSETVLVKRLIE